MGKQINLVLKQSIFGSLWLGISAILFLLVSSVLSAYIVAFLFGMALGGLLVIPPVLLADIFGKDNIGAIRGYTEPFVSGGQAIGVEFLLDEYDISGSYQMSFPLWNFGFYSLCSYYFFSKNKE